VLQMSNREFLIRVSYMEIYNEEIKDLLSPDNRKLQIHESLEVIQSSCADMDP
jgi:centromeric protein E